MNDNKLEYIGIAITDKKLKIKKMRYFSTHQAKKFKAMVGVKNANAVEQCLKVILYPYNDKENKNYYNCSFDVLQHAILKCDEIINNYFHCNECGSKIKNSFIFSHIADELDIDTSEEIIVKFGSSTFDEEGINKKQTNEYKYNKYKSKYIELKKIIKKID
jgi:hypothetical protein